MSPILLWFKVLILTILSRSECFMYSNTGIMSWETVWRKMNTVSNEINIKSSCPWTINTNTYTPQLLHIPEKEKYRCRNCCIDLNLSNSTHLIVNPRGKCHQIKVFIPCKNEKVVVGYTCVYDASIPTDKRNMGHGPIVNGGSRHLQADNNVLNDRTEMPFDNSIWDRKTSKTYPTIQTAKGNINGHFNIDQNNKYPSGIQQYRVPSDNAQIRYPPFLHNNNAQYRPGFLNSLSLQLRPQGVIPLLVHSQRNMDTDVRKPDNKIDAFYDAGARRNGEFSDGKDAQYQNKDGQDSVIDR